MKLYFKIVATVVLLVSCLGLIAPFLISSASSELFLFGVAVLVFLPVVVYQMWESEINKLFKKEETK